MIYAFPGQHTLLFQSLDSNKPIMRTLFYLFIITACVSTSDLSAQRSFVDAPSFYALSRDIENIDRDTGLGLDVGYGIGTHNLMAKISGGLETTTDLTAESITDDIRWTPFLRAEVGAGLWRTNSNECGKDEAMAFTVLPKAGLQYVFNTTETTFPDALNYYVGLELALFKLRDFRRNGEFFIDASYFMSDGPIALKIGTRQFLNTRY